jgi:UDP-N-acetylmuramoyl-L-alanyl-D-glutamate--2,6-diaminopimelate ligase
VLVAGLAAAGQSALSLLTSARGPGELMAWDMCDDPIRRRRAAYWRGRDVDVVLGGNGTALLASAGRNVTIVKSPGIGFDIPLLRMAIESGIEILDELEIGWRAMRQPVIAITGTNGKSTTCGIVAALCRAAGKDFQLVGNTEFGVPLSGARSDVMAICEVSSFQLEAAPTFLPDVAIFTNLSCEHLSRHGTMDAYASVKRRMFYTKGRTCGWAIVNADDVHGRLVLDAVHLAGGRSISYGFTEGAVVQLIDVKGSLYENHIRIRVDGKMVDLRSRLCGRYNALNVAAAFAYGVVAGIDQATIVAGIEGANAPPGRAQRIQLGQDFDVIVDYAHNPDGILQMLRTLREVTVIRGTMLRTVFGAVGYRDAAKGEASAAVAASLSDQLILTIGLTGSSPRIQRLQELYRSVFGRANVQVVLDRAGAIEQACASARQGDIVAVLGLGNWSVVIPDASGALRCCDDRALVRRALANSTQCAS